MGHAIALLVRGGPRAQVSSFAVGESQRRHHGPRAVEDQFLADLEHGAAAPVTVVLGWEVSGRVGGRHGRRRGVDVGGERAESVLD